MGQPFLGSFAEYVYAEHHKWYGCPFLYIHCCNEKGKIKDEEDCDQTPRAGNMQRGRCLYAAVRRLLYQRHNSSSSSASTASIDLTSDPEVDLTFWHSMGGTSAAALVRGSDRQLGAH